MKTPALLLSMATALLSLAILSSCTKFPAPKLPYLTKWQVGGDVDAVLPEFSDYCGRYGLVAQFEVKCTKPITRVKLIAANTGTLAETILFNDTVGALTYGDTVYFSLDEPGRYMLRLIAMTDDAERQMAQYVIHSLNADTTRILQPTTNQNIPYNNQLQGMDVTGTLNAHAATDKARIYVHPGYDFSSTVFNDVINFTGTGPYTFNAHIPSLQPGTYTVQVLTDYSCQIQSPVSFTIY